MPAGYAVASGLVALAAGATETIQPGAGVEWVIHNIVGPSSTTLGLIICDGTNPDTQIDASPGGWMNYVFHLTNSSYLKVKNLGTGLIYVHYDGVQTVGP